MRPFRVGFVEQKAFDGEQDKDIHRRDGGEEQGFGARHLKAARWRRGNINAHDILLRIWIFAGSLMARRNQAGSSGPGWKARGSGGTGIGHNAAAPRPSVRISPMSGREWPAHWCASSETPSWLRQPVSGRRH